MAIFRLSFLLALSFSTVRSAQLQIVEAGKSGRKGPVLKDGFKVCAREIFNGNGISVECESETSNYVVFFVNEEQVRREGHKPYLIAGDANSEIHRWTPLPSGTVTIDCVGENESRTHMDIERVTGTFECDNVMVVKNDSTPAPSTRNNHVQLIIREAGKVDGKSSSPLVQDFRFCVQNFTTGGVSVECVAPSATGAAMTVNNQVVRNESVAPYMIAGDNAGNAFPWMPPLGMVTLGCSTNIGSISLTGQFKCDTIATTPSPSPHGVTDATINNTNVETPTPSPTPRVGISAKYCVQIPSQAHTNKASDLWVPDGMALTYRPNSTYGGTVGPNHAPLRYVFKVQVASHYFIALTSKVPHATEHNDAWIQFDSVTLRREVDGEIQTKPSTSRPLKAYQNSGGKFTGAFSIDHEPHSFATSQVLEPDVNYQITVSARSTMFKLYGIVLFPCTEEQCVRYSQHSRRYTDLCKF